MSSLTLERASAIVEYAAGEFADGNSIVDAYFPFREGGATSRLEARNALLLMVAKSYQLDSPENFESYARSSRFFATRILCDELRYPAEVERVVLESGTDYEAFVSFLRAQTPYLSDFWPKVYERLGLTSQRTTKTFIHFSSIALGQRYVLGWRVIGMILSMYVGIEMLMWCLTLLGHAISPIAWHLNDVVAVWVFLILFITIAPPLASLFLGLFFPLERLVKHEE